MPAPRASIVAFVIFGLSGGADAGQEAQDMKLEDMGFVMRQADTPAQIERLRALPARTFVGRTKDDRRYYLYADPDYCKCVFVGNELAMKNYRDLMSPPPQAPMAIGPGKPSVPARWSRRWIRCSAARSSTATFSIFERAQRGG